MRIQRACALAHSTRAGTTDTCRPFRTVLPTHCASVPIAQFTASKVLHRIRICEAHCTALRCTALLCFAVRRVSFTARVHRPTRPTTATCAQSCEASAHSSSTKARQRAYDSAHMGADFGRSLVALAAHVKRAIIHEANACNAHETYAQQTFNMHAKSANICDPPCSMKELTQASQWWRPRSSNCSHSEHALPCHRCPPCHAMPCLSCHSLPYLPWQPFACHGVHAAHAACRSTGGARDSMRTDAVRDLCDCTPYETTRARCAAPSHLMPCRAQCPHLMPFPSRCYSRLGPLYLSALCRVPSALCRVLSALCRVPSASSTPPVHCSTCTLYCRPH